MAAWWVLFVWKHSFLIEYVAGRMVSAVNFHGLMPRTVKTLDLGRDEPSQLHATVVTRYPHLVPPA
jgi:hypothetical protein